MTLILHNRGFPVKHWVVVSNIFYFYPYLQRWSNLTDIFQMGWNHQPEHLLDVGDFLVEKNMHGVKDVHLSLFPFGTQASSDVLNHQFEDILPAMLKLVAVWKPLELTQKTTVWNFSVTGI